MDHSNQIAVLAVMISAGPPLPKALAAVCNQTRPPDQFMVCIEPKPANKLDEQAKFKRIAAHRNRARRLALKTQADCFWLLDADVVAPACALERLLIRRNAVIGGWYPAKRGAHVGGRWVADNTFQHFYHPVEGMLKTDLIGLGCALVPRWVMMQIEFESGTNEFAQTTQGEWVFLGDCMKWSNQVADLKVQMFLNGSVICKHEHQEA